MNTRGKDGLTGKQRRRRTHKGNRGAARKPVGILVEYTSGHTRTFPLSGSVVDRPRAVAKKKTSPLVRTARIVPLAS